MTESNNLPHNFKAEALILISGLGNDEAVAKALGILHSYNLLILDQQKIFIKGRLIAAFHIALDPAHAAAIETELAEAMSSEKLDVALDIL